MKIIYLVFNRDNEYLDVNGNFSEIGTYTEFFETKESADKYIHDKKDLRVRQAYIGLAETYDRN